MKAKHLWCVMLIVGLCAPSYAQDISISASQKSVEKGEIFQIYLEIESSEGPLYELDIAHQPPLGFALASEPTPKIPNILNAGSNMLITYSVTTPTHKPEILSKARGISTRDAKRFIFNISYSNTPNGPKKHKKVEYSIRYTTSIWYYLLWGLIGLALAHIIKSLAKRRSEPRDEPAKFMRILRYIFSNNIISLMTTLLIGFAVLIILAREVIPTQGWYDTFALGIILGMLGDENLLSKLRGS